jgi:predicted GIY-YIG superfamily endonuclease
MTNQDHIVLYTGVTNNLQRRVIEHKTGQGGIFQKYKLHKLVIISLVKILPWQLPVKSRSRQDLERKDPADQ